jgi:hypothetical protein
MTKIIRVELSMLNCYEYKLDAILRCTLHMYNLHYIRNSVVLLYCSDVFVFRG